ncbi:hypothetical protein A7A09_007455 [Paracoccus methylarcula]|uniref:Uncharacterized protein n=1 Tax=Paracoccus methylarcula TaxID=72022 RepID=A0A422QXY6_9RHOB|nr:hypothetical protein A7A09_007455 [Paracoccus methylarcula]
MGLIMDIAPLHWIAAGAREGSDEFFGQDEHRIDRTGFAEERDWFGAGGDGLVLTPVQTGALVDLAETSYALIF